MKRFYDWPQWLQWIVGLIMFIFGFGGLIVFLVKPFGFFMLPLIAPFANLFSVPFFRLIGYYKYLNPYVLSTVQTDEMYDLHNVFTFDYLVNFKWSDSGRKVQKTLLVHYFKALLMIIDRIEKEELSPDVKVMGHSYFFSDRTAQRLGFDVKDASLFWVINSVFQCIELTYLYSFSQGRLAVPPFWKVKSATIIGRDLVKKKAYLEALVDKIGISK